MDPWSAVISGGAGILDGLLRGKQQATQNRMASNQFWVTTRENRRQFDTGMTFARKNLAAQRQEAAEDRRQQEYFARNSTGWQFDQLMNAADESGIHRLAALGGATGTAYSPVGGVGVGGPAATGGAAGVLPSAGDPAFIGDAVGMALEAARAEKAQKEAEEALALDKARTAAEIERTAAEAELMRSQSRTLVADARRAATGGSTGIVTAEGPIFTDPEDNRRDFRTQLDRQGKPYVWADIDDIDELPLWLGRVLGNEVKNAVRTEMERGKPASDRRDPHTRRP